MLFKSLDPSFIGESVTKFCMCITPHPNLSGLPELS